MEELLKKLLEAQILSEDTKVELESAFNRKLQEAVAVAKANAEAEQIAEMRETWYNERDLLIEALDTKVDEMLKSELGELRHDLERFRDLEAEYASKVVETKSEMTVELKKDLRELVEKIDNFLEIRLNSELADLREDITIVKKNEFGRSIYEAFANEFMSNFSDSKRASYTMRELEKRLHETEEALEESEGRIANMVRDSKMRKVLAPLKGKQRDIMEAILKNVETDQLEEGYKTFIGRVLRESDEYTSEKENTLLAEGTTAKKKTSNTKRVTGDRSSLLENKEVSKTIDSYRKLAGL